MNTAETLERIVTILPPKPEAVERATRRKKLRVAAYCRVSTEQEEQQSSYEAQINYYTEKINGNAEWTLVDIFADGSDKIGLNQQSPYSKGGALI